tara:strand:- start:148 stop:390 length:243 start_codon:yes stop_codon:yes gene_type:complete
MNHQALRILSQLTHSQLLDMHFNAVDNYNVYCYENEGKDDIGNFYHENIKQMLDDIKHLEIAVHDAFIEEYREESEELPF